MITFSISAPCATYAPRWRKLKTGLSLSGRLKIQRVLSFFNKNRQGCELSPEGARTAALIILFMISVGIFVYILIETHFSPAALINFNIDLFQSDILVNLSSGPSATFLSMTARNFSLVRSNPFILPFLEIKSPSLLRFSVDFGRAFSFTIFLKRDKSWALSKK